MGKRKKKKRRGHFCWSCERIRANERFSGKGHARHLCKDCSKLGKEELEFRQARRNMERCFTWEGFLKRKRRKEFERFLNHSTPRIRDLALCLKEESDRQKELMKEAREYDEEAARQWERQFGSKECAHPVDETTTTETNSLVSSESDEDDEWLPF